MNPWQEQQNSQFRLEAPPLPSYSIGQYSHQSATNPYNFPPPNDQQYAYLAQQSQDRSYPSYYGTFQSPYHHPSKPFAANSFYPTNTNSFPSTWASNSNSTSPSTPQFPQFANYIPNQAQYWQAAYSPFHHLGSHLRTHSLPHIGLGVPPPGSTLYSAATFEGAGVQSASAGVIGYQGSQQGIGTSSGASGVLAGSSKGYGEGSQEAYRRFSVPVPPVRSGGPLVLVGAGRSRASGLGQSGSIGQGCEEASSGGSLVGGSEGTGVKQASPAVATSSPANIEEFTGEELRGRNGTTGFIFSAQQQTESATSSVEPLCSTTRATSIGTLPIASSDLGARALEIEKKVRAFKDQIREAEGATFSPGISPDSTLLSSTATYMKRNTRDLQRLFEEAQRKPFGDSTMSVAPSNAAGGSSTSASLPSATEHELYKTDLKFLVVPNLKNIIKDTNYSLRLSNALSGRKSDLVERLCRSFDDLRATDLAKWTIMKDKIVQYSGKDHSGAGGSGAAVGSSGVAGTSGGATYGAGSSGTTTGATNTYPKPWNPPAQASSSHASYNSKSQIHNSSSTSGTSYSGGNIPSPAIVASWPKSNVGSTSSASPVHPTFKRSPFYTFVKPVSNTNYCPKAFPGDRKSTFVTFTLTEEDRQRLLHARSNPKEFPQYQLRLFCTFEDDYTPPAPYRSSSAPNTKVSRIKFPDTCEAKLNGVSISGNLRGIKKLPGSAPPPNLGNVKSTGASSGVPHHSAGYDQGFVLDLRRNATNRVELIYINSDKNAKREDAKAHYLVACLVEAQPRESIVNKVRKGKYRSKEDVLRQLKEVAQDTDIIATSTEVSLRDPLSFIRISTPIRSLLCDHLQCFDLDTYIMMMESTPTWACPVCAKVINYEDLSIDKYFEDFLRLCPDDVDTVKVEVDGTWSAEDGKYGNAKSVKPGPPPKQEARPKEEPNDDMKVPRLTDQQPPITIDLDDDDDDDDDQYTAASTRHRPRPIEVDSSPMRGMSGSNPPPAPHPNAVIDLTLSDSDDDRPPPQPSRTGSNAFYNDNQASNVNGAGGQKRRRDSERSWSFEEDLRPTGRRRYD